MNACESPWETETCHAEPTHRFKSDRLSRDGKVVFSFNVVLCEHHLMEEFHSLDCATDRQITVQPLKVAAPV
jgi:hypothetical protein